MIWVILIALTVGLLIVAVWWIKQVIFTHDIVHNFKKCNVIVFGKKGTGKDLIFQKVINKRKDFYYSNIPYSKDKKIYKLVSLKEISVHPNTYEKFIEGRVEKIKRNFYEKKDIYISDGGVYLPSQYDSKLDKEYPSFPIFYALSRHLYESNIHINTQNLERVWKKLREQADFYVCCKKTIKLPFFVATKCITYDKYQSAVNGVLPIKTRILNKYSKAEVDVYNATNGEIRSGWVIQRKRKIKYDTRYFEKVILLGKRKIKSRS